MSLGGPLLDRVGSVDKSVLDELQRWDVYDCQHRRLDDDRTRDGGAGSRLSAYNWRADLRVVLCVADLSAQLVGGGFSSCLCADSQMPKGLPATSGPADTQ